MGCDVRSCVRCRVGARVHRAPLHLRSPGRPSDAPTSGRTELSIPAELTFRAVQRYHTKVYLNPPFTAATTGLTAEPPKTSDSYVQGNIGMSGIILRCPGSRRAELTCSVNAQPQGYKTATFHRYVDGRFLMLLVSFTVLYCVVVIHDRSTPPRPEA